MVWIIQHDYTNDGTVDFYGPFSKEPTQRFMEDLAADLAMDLTDGPYDDDEFAELVGDIVDGMSAHHLPPHGADV